MTENPNGAPSGAPIDPPEDDEESGYAVYDLTLKRFVSGVHPSRSKANDSTSKVKSHKYETRKV